MGYKITAKIAFDTERISQDYVKCSVQLDFRRAASQTILSVDGGTLGRVGRECGGPACRAVRARGGGLRVAQCRRAVGRLGGGASLLRDAGEHRVHDGREVAQEALNLHAPLATWSNGTPYKVIRSGLH